MDWVCQHAIVLLNRYFGIKIIVCNIIKNTGTQKLLSKKKTIF